MKQILVIVLVLKGTECFVDLLLGCVVLKDC